MGYLIVIRGPTGVGKSTVVNEIRRMLGYDKAYSLNLDEIIPHIFQGYLDEAQRYEHVVGEMYYGDSHTTNPHKWMKFFKDHKKLSVVLQASLETCFQRVNSSSRDLRCPQIERYKSEYYEPFQLRQKQNVFANNAGINEITIDAETKSAQQIAEDILLAVGYR